MCSLIAHPFGGHPALLQYLDWIETKGFTYKTGRAKSPNGGTIFAVWINGPKGEPLMSIGDMALDERLTPSTIERFDRRLGIKSPFARKPR